MKIVFLGTPKFGADVLEILAQSKHEVVGVVCQPDRLGNRKKIEVCAVKQLATQLELPVFQFEKVSLKHLGLSCCYFFRIQGNVGGSNMNFSCLF